MRSLTKNLVTLVAIIASVCYIGQASAAVITAWNFENPPDSIAVNNNPVPTVGVGMASSIGMNIYPTPAVGVTTDDVSMGVAGDTGVNANANTSQIWRVRAQAAPGGGAANGWSSTAPIAAQGAVFAASTAGFSGPITVSYDWYATNQGEAKQQLQYTDDGTNWNNVPITLNASDVGLLLLNNAISPNTVNGFYVAIQGGGQGWFPGLAATINDPLAAGNPNFAIRMVNASTDGDNISAVGGPLNNNSGNWRFDNISISGVAVPEPSTMALAALALVGLAAYRMRRQS